jgi:hypothetical protein
MLLLEIEKVKKVDHFLFRNMYYSSNEIMKRVKRDDDFLQYIDNQIFINSKDGVLDIIEELPESLKIISMIILEKKNEERNILERDDIDNIKAFYEKDKNLLGVTC